MISIPKLQISVLATSRRRPQIRSLISKPAVLGGITTLNRIADLIEPNDEIDASDREHPREMLAFQEVRTSTLKNARMC
jgi:hypothetical protein